MSCAVGISAAPDEEETLRELPADGGGGWVGGVPKDMDHWLVTRLAIHHQTKKVVKGLLTQ